eukprot:2297100-Pleurochrysis_carterae.AAC.1
MGRLRDPKSKSPGLAANTLAMCEFAYGGKRQAAAAATTASLAPAAAAATAAHPPKQQSCCTRRRRAGPSLGFCAGGGSDEVVAEDGSAEPDCTRSKWRERSARLDFWAEAEGMTCAGDCSGTSRADKTRWQ